MSKDIPYRLLDPKVIEDPYPFYSALLNHAPVYQLHDTNVYLVSSWQLIHQLLKKQHDYTVNLTGILMSGSEGQLELFDFSQFGGTVDALARTTHTQYICPPPGATVFEILNGLRFA